MISPREIDGRMPDSARDHALRTADENVACLGEELNALQQMLEPGPISRQPATLVLSFALLGDAQGQFNDASDGGRALRLEHLQLHAAVSLDGLGKLAHGLREAYLWLELGGFLNSPMHGEG